MTDRQCSPLNFTVYATSLSNLKRLEFTASPNVPQQRKGRTQAATHAVNTKGKGVRQNPRIVHIIFKKEHRSSSLKVTAGCNTPTRIHVGHMCIHKGRGSKRTFPHYHEVNIYYNKNAAQGNLYLLPLLLPLSERASERATNTEKKKVPRNAKKSRRDANPCGSGGRREVTHQWA